MCCSAKSTKHECNHEGTKDRPELREIQQNNWSCSSQMSGT